MYDGLCECTHQDLYINYDMIAGKAAACPRVMDRSSGAMARVPRYSVRLPMVPPQRSMKRAVHEAQKSRKPVLPTDTETIIGLKSEKDLWQTIHSQG